MKTTIILSGGLDSSTLAYYLKKEGHDLLAISFNYGQKHAKELECAKKIADGLNINHIVVDMNFIGEFLKSSLTRKDEEIPEGYYTAENMRSTVVPNRNLIMASLAHAIGSSMGYTNIALGVHSGDHAIYPDCRKEFILSLEKVLQTSNDDPMIHVYTSFWDLSKIDIVKLGLELGVPFENTWTCYKGNQLACGKCGSCQERLEAFEKNNWQDPLFYVES